VVLAQLFHEQLEAAGPLLLEESPQISSTARRERHHESWHAPEDAADMQQRQCEQQSEMGHKIAVQAWKGQKV
jgi:hypothetical protein